MYSELYSDFENCADDSTLLWDEETKTVSLNLRLKTATALVAVGLLVASPAQAQVVVGRAGSGAPDVQVVTPPRVDLPPEWLRHIPKAAGNKPYQPSRTKPAGTGAGVSPTYTSPKPLPITPSTLPTLRAPQFSERRTVSGIDSYDLPQPERRQVRQESHLMAAPWSPRAQHTDRPLFPELQPKPAAPAPTSTRHGAVLAAPQLGGTKPVVTRDSSTLPPVLTPDLMSSLQQAARDEDAGVPPTPPAVPRDEGNGINASSAQDRTQTLGTIEHSRVQDIIAAREGRARGGAASRRLFSADDTQQDTPLPGRQQDDIPLPPTPPAPTPAPSTQGYLVPPRGREDEVTVPDKAYPNDSLAPLDKADEVTVRVESAPPVADNASNAKRRVLGSIGDTQKPTVYNAPVPLPSARADATAESPVPVPDAPPAAADQATDDKAFKAEGRKLFSAPKIKSKKTTAPKISAAEQMSLFDATSANDGSKLVKLPTATAAEANTNSKIILVITPEGPVGEVKPTTTESSPAVATTLSDSDSKTASDLAAKEVKEVPVNPTPFGDKVISTISADDHVEPVATGTVAETAGVPDITTATEAPKLLGKGPRKSTTKKKTTEPVSTEIATPPRVEEPAPPKVEEKPDDEVRVAIDDTPPPSVLREKPRPQPQSPVVSPAPTADESTHVLVPPTSLAPLDENTAGNAAPTVVKPDAAPAPTPTPTPTVEQRAAPAAPRVNQEQLYVQTPAAAPHGQQRLRTPKLVLQSKLPAVSAPAPVATPPTDAMPTAAIAEQDATVIERPELTPPPEPEITPTVIAPPAAAIELRMPTITFGPTERDLDAAGESQAQLLAEQLSLNPGRRVTLIAYAQAPNLNESRRVALSRALAIRSRLAEAGIQPIRVSIRALGALPPGDRGSPDRVDTIVQ